MAFISHRKAVFSEQSLAYVGAERQTNIHTYMHTHTLFEKQSVNQECAHSWPLAGCGHAPSLK